MISERSTPPPNSKATQYWVRQLVHCRLHRQACCWVQTDGSHIFTQECRCGDSSPAGCPIDGHRIPWVLAHPDFEVMDA